MTLCAPAVRAEVESIATPLALSALTPSWLVPSIKVTEPVGTPAAPGVTVAVNVTDWFKLAAAGLAFKAVVVFDFWTTWLNTDDVLGSEFVSPL